MMRGGWRIYLDRQLHVGLLELVKLVELTNVMRLVPRLGIHNRILSSLRSNSMNVDLIIILDPFRVNGQERMIQHASIHWT